MDQEYGWPVCPGYAVEHLGTFHFELPPDGGFQLVMGGTPIAGWLMSWEMPLGSIKMDDPGPPFQETSICTD